MEIRQVQSMDKVNADDKTKTYQYVMILQSLPGRANWHNLWQTPVGFRCTVIIMLTVCLRSVVHGLFQMGLLQASTQQRFTPGLNDNSPSHPHLQIHSPDMVRRLTLPRPKKETYI